MRKTLPALFLAFSASAFAQTPLTTAVDFTATDIDGNQFNLFDKLDAGYHVVLDFMFTTCGPCQATGPKLYGGFTNFGCNNAAADVFFVSINRDDDNSVMHTWEATYMNPTGPYPLGISGTQGSESGGPQTLHNTYGVGAFPTMILIAPDRQIIEQDMWPITDASTFTTYFESHGLSQSSCSVGIEEELAQRDLTLAPVPAGSEVSLSVSRGQILSIEMVDLSGRSVLVIDQVAAVRATVDVSGMNAGAYTAKVRKDDGSLLTRRFIKQ
jgi:thiol-disulfide isomerase/thioredoxin